MGFVIYPLDFPVYSIRLSLLGQKYLKSQINELAVERGDSLFSLVSESLEIRNIPWPSVIQGILNSICFPCDRNRERVTTERNSYHPLLHRCFI